MKKHFPNIIVIAIIFLLVFSIKDAFLGKLKGTFAIHKIPDDYNKVEEYLSNQSSFSRTLWIPEIEKFGFYNQQHPAVNSLNFFNKSDLKSVLDELQKPQTEEKLQEASIQFVILPFDSDQEIFIKDRKYDKSLYENTLYELKGVPYLKEMPGFGKVHIFSLSGAKDHFWLVSKEGKVRYQLTTPVEYKIEVTNVRKDDKLIFSDTFDSRWIATIKELNQEKQIASKQFKNTFNSFDLPNPGTYELSIRYLPQKWVNIGSIVSLVTCISCVSILLFLVYIVKK